VRVRRKLGEGVVDRRQAFLAGHRVQVIEHDDQPAPPRRHAVHEFVDGDLDRAARHVETAQRAPPEPRPHPIDRRRDVPPQPDRIVVAGVERHPRQRAIEVCAPGAHGGSLAVARRSRDECQRLVTARVERMANTRPIDQTVTHTRNRELGLGKRARTLRPTPVLSAVRPRLKHVHIRVLHKLAPSAIADDPSGGRLLVRACAGRRHAGFRTSWGVRTSRRHGPRRLLLGRSSVLAVFASHPRVRHVESLSLPEPADIGVHHSDKTGVTQCSFVGKYG
jgi:hypothetical protein